MSPYFKDVVQALLETVRAGAGQRPCWSGAQLTSVAAGARGPALLLLPLRLHAHALHACLPALMPVSDALRR